MIWLFLARQDSGIVQPRWAKMTLDGLLQDVVGGAASPGGRKGDCAAADGGRTPACTDSSRNDRISPPEGARSAIQRLGHPASRSRSIGAAVHQSGRERTAIHACGREGWSSTAKIGSNRTPIPFRSLSPIRELELLLNRCRYCSIDSIELTPPGLKLPPQAPGWD